MKKIAKQKLLLNKTVVRQLDEGKLGQIAGGSTASCYSIISQQTAWGQCCTHAGTGCANPN
jgi:hypothetical protein